MKSPQVASSAFLLAFACFLLGSLGCQGEKRGEKMNPAESNVQAIRKTQELEFPGRKETEAKENAQGGDSKEKAAEDDDS